MSDNDSDRLKAAEELLRAGSVGQAVGALRGLITDQPMLAGAHALLGEALLVSGDGVGGEAALRAALALEPALAAAATMLAIRLNQRRRWTEAATLLAPFLDRRPADAGLLNALGAALKSLGRMDEAVGAYGLAVQAAPTSGVFEHNLAGTLGDANRFAESEAAARRAMAKGLDAPETWLVLGRALIGLSRLEEGETALRESIRRRPAFADAHGELAQLIWMRTEDLAAASETLDAALKAAPLDARLSLAKAKLLQYVEGPASAYASLAPAVGARPGDIELQVNAALLALPDDPAVAMFHALSAQEIDPASPPAAAALCQANLAVGRADVAAAIAEKLSAEWPLDQHPVTLAGTAWRVLGDARYRELYDYERLVRGFAIDTPLGWASLGAYLADLATACKKLQTLRGHPIGQSLRQGAQTGQSLARSDDPAIKAFFAAIDGPIRAYIDALRGRDDVLGRRVTDGYRFSGAWSVLLRPGGHHVDHIHPMGWISSAFHVELPTAVDHGHEGWLKFGEPELATTPLLEAEHFVKPRPGMLVLFPSYMWHGTVPFGGDSPRLSIAFDVLPA